MGLSDVVFKLIKSLSVEEKRHFEKENALRNQKTAPLYIELYNIMEDTVKDELYNELDGKYSEEGLQKKIADTRLKKHLSVYKHTLYEYLLQSLRSYYNEDKASTKLYNLLREVQLLINRGMHKAAYKRLRVAKSLAEKYDYRIELLRLLETERRLIRRFERREQEQKIEAIKRQSEECVRIISYNNQVQNLYDRFYLQTINEKLTAEEKEETKHQILQIEQRINDTGLHSFHLMNNLVKLKLVLYYKDHEFTELALKHQRNMMTLFQEHHHMISEDPDNYISFSHNYMLLLLRQKAYDEIQMILGQLRKLTIPIQEGGHGINLLQVKARLFQISYFTELALLARQEHYKEAVALIPTIEEGLSTYKKHIPVSLQLMFFQNIAGVYFLDKQYQQVLPWINRILTLEDSHKMKMNTRLLSRLIQIIVHFELEDYGIVAEHLVPSFRKHLSRYKNHPEIAKSGTAYRKMLSVLSKASYSTKDKKRKLLSQFYEDAKAIPIFALILPWIKAQAEK